MKTKYLFPVLLLLTVLFFSCKQQADDTPVYSIVSSETSSDYTGNVILYKSTDAAGKPVVLSGYFAYPKNQEAKQIILYVHGTIFLNSQAPSETKTPELVSFNASKGRVIICPDYLGYGITADKIHPYMNQEVTARNSLDMELAVLQYFKDNNIPINDDYYTVVAGYSQGGASTLATHRYIESLSQEKQKLINLKASYAGGSPADLKATMMTFLDPSFTITNEHILLSFYVIQSMYESYPEVFRGYSLQDFYKIPLSFAYSGINFYLPDLINSKNQTNLAMCYGFMTTAIDLNSPETVYSEKMLTEGSDLRNKFLACLERNNLTDWEPKAPLYIYHSTVDDVVPYANYQALMASDKMGRYSSKVTGTTGTGTHGGFCTSVYYQKVTQALAAMN